MLKKIPVNNEEIMTAIDETNIAQIRDRSLRKGPIEFIKKYKLNIYQSLRVVSTNSCFAD